MEVLFALACLALGMIAAKRKRWLWVRLCLVSVLLCFIPVILRRHTIVVDRGLEAYLFMALFLHLLGGVIELYTRYNWDFLTHVISGVGVAAAFLVIITTFDRYTETINLSPLATALVVVMFTVASGVLWEIGEFTSDTLWGTHEQQGLYDIITDIANDLAGSAITAVFAALYVKDPGKLISLDYNAIRRFYPQLGYMHNLIFICIIIFLLYFAIKKEWVPLFLSLALAVMSALSGLLKVPLLVTSTLFAILLIRFIAGILSLDMRLYATVFSVCGLVTAYVMSATYVTDPWFFAALVPVAALFFSSICEILGTSQKGGYRTKGS